MALSIASQGLIPYSGQNSGQTLDTHSYASVVLDDSGTLIISCHVYKSNQPNTQFTIAYVLDGGAGVQSNAFFTTDATGTGNLAFSVPNVALTSHRVVVEVNTTTPPNCFYVPPTAGGAISVPWPPAAQPSTSTQSQQSMATQGLIPWSGQNSGQTLDAHSYASVVLDDSGTLIISCHVYKSNQPNTQFTIAYVLDGGAGTQSNAFFTTDATGSGNLAFSVPNVALTSHRVVVEVNTTTPAHCFYVPFTPGGAISVPWPPAAPSSTSTQLQQSTATSFLISYNGAHSNDLANSLVKIILDSSGKLTLSGSLARSDLPNTNFTLEFSLDGGFLLQTIDTFTTDTNGTGTFALAVTGVPLTSHWVKIALVLTAALGNVCYVDGSGAVIGSSYPGSGGYGIANNPGIFVSWPPQ